MRTGFAGVEDGEDGEAAAADDAKGRGAGGWPLAARMRLSREPPPDGGGPAELEREGAGPPLGETPPGASASRATATCGTAPRSDAGIAAQGVQIRVADSVAGIQEELPVWAFFCSLLSRNKMLTSTKVYKKYKNMQPKMAGLFTFFPKLAI